MSHSLAAQKRPATQERQFIPKHSQTVLKFLEIQHSMMKEEFA